MNVVAFLEEAILFDRVEVIRFRRADHSNDFLKFASVARIEVGIVWIETAFMNAGCGMNKATFADINGDVPPGDGAVVALTTKEKEIAGREPSPSLRHIVGRSFALDLTDVAKNIVSVRIEREIDKSAAVDAFC